MEGAVLMGNKKAAEVLHCLYPEKFTADEKHKYKQYIADQEAACVKILRRHAAYGLKYVVEVLKRFLKDWIWNVINKITNPERANLSFLLLIPLLLIFFSSS